MNDCIRYGILVSFLTEHRIHLTQQILKKIKTGKSLEQIAAEVEEKPEDIRALYEELIAAGR